MNLTSYSPAFREEAVRKVLTRGDRTIAEIAEQLNVPYHSLRNWIRNPKMAPINKRAREKASADWTPEEQLQALQETYNLPEEALRAWCREKGVFAHQLESWRTAFCINAKPAGASAGEMRTLKEKIGRLERDLNRKDKALSEAAALLVLQKKYQALWEDEGK